MRDIRVVSVGTNVLNYYDNTQDLSGLSLFSFPSSNADIIYAFDKVSFVGSIFGEIQNNFQMALTIAGDKDTKKIVVISFGDNDLEPNTIIYHPRTTTWWIVKDDRKQRFQNDDDFVYEHELDLVGAVELFNARDLTDNGFYQDDYTIPQYVARLLQLSNIEYSIRNLYSDIDNNLVVPFIKSFENYTLLSGLREILDSYNYCPKLSFNAYLVNSEPTILSFDLTFIPKTGSNDTPIDISHFTDVRETSNFNGSSFGSTVVSNAENVISTKAKTYPLLGSAKLVAPTTEVMNSNAYLRLPSNIYLVNWLKLHIGLTIWIDYGTFSGSNYQYFATRVLYANNDNSVNFLFSYVYSLLGNTTFYPSQSVRDYLLYVFNGSIESFVEDLIKVSTVSLWGGNNFDPTTNKVIKGKNTTYIPIFDSLTLTDPNIEMTLVDKENGASLPTIEQGIWYERGSDKITHFDFLDNWKYVNPEYTDWRNATAPILEITSGNYGIRLRVDVENTITGGILMSLGQLSCSINYIPMSDIKIKVDNQSDKNDIQLYNQNGKLTDSNALSKLINSYATEISSDTITRYKTYYKWSDVVKVGQIVLNNGKKYVVNNVSLDFSHNDDYSYVIDCQVSMSKQYAVKSLMVSPNTNIRDYGIPQNFNVKRKQLYRDYYEFDYTSSGNVDTPYLIKYYAINFDNYSNANLDYLCFIRTKYLEEINGSDTWYYQLEPTRYEMNKMFYIVLDFKDNNIIGYDVQNIFSGFDVTKLLTGLGIVKNTPISYVDLDGKVEDFEILYLSKQNATNVYEYYVDSVVSSNPTIVNYNLSNVLTFIPQELFDYAFQENEFSMSIYELRYRKDPIEVPVFEYSCQIADSENVIIGDNILVQHENCVYFYTYKTGSNLTINNSYDNQELSFLESPARIAVAHGVVISFNYISNYLTLALKTSLTYDYSSMQAGSSISPTTNQDLAIFRIAYDLTNGNVYRELMFIAKNVPTANIISGALRLYTNYWKLK